VRESTRAERNPSSGAGRERDQTWSVRATVLGRRNRLRRARADRRLVSGVRRRLHDRSGGRRRSGGCGPPRLGIRVGGGRAERAPLLMTMAFRSHPDPSPWDDYVDYESTSWPRKDRRRYWIIPSVCFNCEAACGILAYVDKEQLTVRKIEGNPLHPGSRGR